MWSRSSCEECRPHSLHLALVQSHRKMHAFMGQYESLESLGVVEDNAVVESSRLLDSHGVVEDNVVVELFKSSNFPSSSSNFISSTSGSEESK